MISTEATVQTFANVFRNSHRNILKVNPGTLHFQIIFC